MLTASREYFSFNSFLASVFSYPLILSMSSDSLCDTKLPLSLEPNILKILANIPSTFGSLFNSNMISSSFDSELKGK